LAASGHPKLVSAAIASEHLTYADCEAIAARLDPFEPEAAPGIVDLLLTRGCLSKTSVLMLVERYRQHPEVHIGFALERFALGEAAPQVALHCIAAGDFDTPLRWLGGYCTPNLASSGQISGFSCQIDPGCGALLGELLSGLEGTPLAREVYRVASEKGVVCRVRQSSTGGDELTLAEMLRQRTGAEDASTAISLELPGVISTLERDSDGLCAARFGGAIARYAAEVLGSDPRSWEVTFSLAPEWQGSVRDLFELAQVLTNQRESQRRRYRETSGLSHPRPIVSGASGIAACRLLSPES